MSGKRRIFWDNGGIVKKILIISVIWLISVLNVHAGNSKESMINDLYKKSGLEIQIRQLPSAINAYMDLNTNKELNKADLSWLKDIAVKVFDSVVLEKTIKEQLSRELDEACIKDVLKWLDSPLGKKITRLEEEGSSAEAMAEMQKYASQLQKSPQINERLALIKEFGESVHASEVLSEIVTQCQFAAAVASMMSLPVEKRIPVDELRKILEKTKPKIITMMMNQFVMSSLYNYRSLNDSELREYITFAKSPYGTKYHIATINAQKKPLVEYGIKVGEALANKTDSGNNLKDI